MKTRWTIAHGARALNWILLTLTLVQVGCDSSKKDIQQAENRGEPKTISWDQLHRAAFKTPSGDRIKIKLAITDAERVRGLSGTKPEDFGEDEGMLFWDNQDRVVQFWMPNTYFNLDLFYLDATLKVLDIDRNLQHSPGTDTPDSEIPRGSRVLCRFVLEMKASSPIAAKIKKGDRLSWISKPSYDRVRQEIEKFTR